MSDKAVYLHELERLRALIPPGVHQTLSYGLNSYVYPLALTLAFVVFFHFINKLVYSLTSNSYIYSLCINKHRSKKIIQAASSGSHKISAQVLNLNNNGDNEYINDRAVLLSLHNENDNAEEIDSPEMIESMKRVIIY